VLVITSIILKFNWYDKLPAPTPDPIPENQDKPGKTTSLAR
jgi:hypothetical protein